LKNGNRTTAYKWYDGLAFTVLYFGAFVVAFPLQDWYEKTAICSGEDPFNQWDPAFFNGKFVLQLLSFTSFNILKVSKKLNAIWTL